MELELPLSWVLPTAKARSSILLFIRYLLFHHYLLYIILSTQAGFMGLELSVGPGLSQEPGLEMGAANKPL